MGNTTSALEVGKVFQSFLSSEPPSAELLDSTFLISVSDDEFGRAVPLETLRDMRHCYTRNFALLLHHCVLEVATMAKRRGRKAVNPKELETAVPRFFGALRLLRRLIPAAFESSSIAVGGPRGSGQTDDTSAPGEGEGGAPATRAAAATSPDGASGSSGGGAPAGGNEVSSEPATPAAPRPPPTDATRNFVHAFFLRGKTCDDAHPEETFPPVADCPAPLGKLLIWSLVECCFIPGLTLPPVDLPETPEFSLTHPEVNLDLLWFTGISCVDPFKKSPSCDASISTARKNVLEAMLSVLSLPLYCDAGARDKIFTEPMLSTIEVPLMPTLAASLLNTILHYEPYSLVPYASHFVNDVEKVVVAASCRVLCSCLCYIGVPIESMPVSRPPTEDRPVVRTTTSGIRPGRTAKHHVDPEQGDEEPEDDHENGGDSQNKAEQRGHPEADKEDEEEEEEENESKEEGHVAGDEEDHHHHSETKEDDEEEEEEERNEGAADEEGQDHVPDTLAKVRKAPAGTWGSHSGEEHNRSHSDSLQGEESMSMRRGSGHNPSSAPLRFVHCVRKMINSLTIMEAKEILTTFIKIIGLHSYASQTYLPESQRAFTSEDEFMMLMWKLIDISPEVDVQFANRGEVLKYLVPFLDYALEARRKVRYINRLQLVIFILLRLSEMRGFGVLCNQPVKEFISFSFPKLSSNATYNDMIVVAMCLVMESKEGALTPLFTSCSVVLNNLAPFITTIGKLAAVKLVNVFCSASQYCLARGSEAGSIAQTVMVNTCESIASLLQYHESGSHYVLAALVDNRESVRRVNDAYIISKTHTLRIPTSLPFLVDVLAAAVSFVLPSVEALPTCPPMGVPAPTPGQPAPKPLFVPSLTDNADVMKKLGTVTLVGVLPTPHRIMVKRFQSTRSVELWAITVHWNTVFSFSSNGTFGDPSSVRLLQFS